MELNIHVDGGARGNPGPAGAGVVIRTVEGQRVHEAGYFLGHATNNVAEYQALIHALQRAQKLPVTGINIYSDSELLVRQITGEYRVKAAGLIGLYEQVQRLLLKTPRWHLKHVRREQNSRADELANMAMDRRRDVIVYDLDAGAAEQGAATEPPLAADVDADMDPASVAQPTAPPTTTPTAPTAVPRTEGPAVRVTISHQPAAGACPAGGLPPESFTIQSTLPERLCIHAAHAVLPTVLAILNTEPHEFAAIPTMTVRCAHPGCNAVIQVSPQRGPNGTAGR